MEADEFRIALQSLGMTQEGFAVLVGATPRTGRKWALGEARVPGAVVLLLWVFQKYPDILTKLRGMPPLPTRARVAAKPKPRRRLKERS